MSKERVIAASLAEDVGVSCQGTAHSTIITNTVLSPALSRAKKISYAFYHRTLSRLKAVQQQCSQSLEQLKASLDVVSAKWFKLLVLYSVH